MEEKARPKVTAKIIEVDPNDLVLLEVNARFMKHEQYQRLVENVKHDGCLTSVPFAAKIFEGPNEGKYEVVSGNHRVKASIAAGLTKVHVLATDEKLDPAHKMGIQLSHNSIAGEDDYAILKELYEGIDDVDMKLYAGLDDKTLEMLEKVRIESIGEVGLKYQILSLIFTPDELDATRAMVETIRESAKNCDEAWIARFSDYDRFVDGLDEVGSAYQIKNMATSLMLLLSIYNTHKSALQAGYLDENGEALHNNWVPLSSILGTSKIPAKAAAIVKRAVDKMIDDGVLKKKNAWQAIELLSADYVAGA